MFCGQGCGLWDSLISPKSLNRPVISNKYLDVGCKCLACDFDFLSLFSNSTLFAWNTVVVRLCVRPSVRPSVTEGQRKRFDPEKQEAVSLAIERQELELSNPCDRQPWY